MLKVRALTQYEKDFIQELSAFSGISQKQVKDFLLFWFALEMVNCLENPKNQKLRIPFIGEIDLSTTIDLKNGEEEISVVGDFKPTKILEECLGEIKKTNQLSFLQNFFVKSIQEGLENILEEE